MVLIKKDKRCVYRKIYLCKKNPNNCISGFNDNAKILSGSKKKLFKKIEVTCNIAQVYKLV
jgi:hypothetical protein